MATTLEILNDAIPRSEIVSGFTHAELEEAFKLVRDGRDWKGPVEGWVDVAKLPAVLMAVEYFTATKPWISNVGVTGENVLVKAKGYRAGPAGP